MTTTEIALGNKNTSDDVLATIAKKALDENNEEILRRLALHPGAGPKTLSIIAK